jgi:SET domain-containing protein
VARASRSASQGQAEVGTGLAVKRGRHGRGVFATRRFLKGETVERCPTLELRDSEVSGRLGDYVYSSSKDGDVLLVLGYGMLYNHSDVPNVEYVQDDPSTIEFLALRTVSPGDELTIDYGRDWWETRGLEPG